MGFIKSTDHRPLTHRPTDHRPTDPPTHRPNNHRPNNKIIFKRLDDREIFILQNKNAAGKINIHFRLFNIYLNRIEVFKTLSFYNYVCFLSYKLLLLYSTNISKLISIHGNFCKTRCLFQFFFFNSVQQENMLNLGA